MNQELMPQNTGTHVSRRQILRIAAVSAGELAVGGLLAACGQSATPSVEETTTPPTPEASKSPENPIDILASVLKLSDYRTIEEYANTCQRYTFDSNSVQQLRLRWAPYQAQGLTTTNNRGESRIFRIVDGTDLDGEPDIEGNSVPIELKLFPPNDLNGQHAEIDDKTLDTHVYMYGRRETFERLSTDPMATKNVQDFMRSWGMHVGKKLAIHLNFNPPNEKFSLYELPAEDFNPSVEGTAIETVHAQTNMRKIDVILNMNNIALTADQIGISFEDALLGMLANERVGYFALDKSEQHPTKKGDERFSTLVNKYVIETHGRQNTSLLIGDGALPLMQFAAKEMELLKSAGTPISQIK